ncbi:MAG: MFS family permease [Cryomorphaceae bacterium]|jgi:MFS family permease
MLGDGLQSTLLAVRATREGFSNLTTGLVMSSFYMGFLGGTLWAPRIVKKVGHIRVFAALASVASACILVHAAFPNPAAWIVLRLISGFCFSGVYIVAESWLNESATNETRGHLLSVYMVITYVAVGAGQLFLNLADTTGYALFVLTSVLISVAVIPLLLTAAPAPEFARSSSVNLKQLYQISPLGIVGMFGVGMVSAALFGVAPVYASQSGMDTAEISYFMLAPIVATVLLQWPIGRLSDSFDRRKIILLVTILAALAAVLCIYMARISTSHLFVAFGLFGGFSLPMYALCIAHTNDSLEPSQMVAASGGLILAGGIGSIFGPVGVALAMDFSADWFFTSMAIVHAAIGLFVISRMFTRDATPLEEQGHHAPATLMRSGGMIESIQEHLRDDYIDED